MNDVWLKTIVPVILAVVSAFGAHSCRVEYIQAQDQESKGRLVMTMNKVCVQGEVHETTQP